jgi:hypothetical protein
VASHGCARDWKAVRIQGPQDSASSFPNASFIPQIADDIQASVMGFQGHVPITHVFDIPFLRPVV